VNRKSILSGFLNLFLLSMLLVAFFSGVSSHAAVSEAEWSMFQHDAAHTGYSSNGLPANIVSLWNASAASVISNVAVAQNYVYFISRDEIFALNASNGKSVWSSPSSSSDTDKLYNIIHECPAVVDGYVYTKYCAYDALTGQLMLDYTRNGVYGSPTVAEGVILINTNFGNLMSPDGLIALNAKTGVKIWDFKEDSNGHMPGFMNHPPAIANGVVYFPCASGVYAFNVQTGDQIWRVPINGFAGYVTVADGNVYCVLPEHGYYGPSVFYCFDASTGHTKWTCHTPATYQPSVANGVVYVRSNALNASTGKLIWNNTLLTSSQAIAGDIVYSVNIRKTSRGGEYSSVYEIHALNASTGNEEGIYSLGHLQNGLNEFPRFPAIANGTLYISQSVGEYDSSRVFCLGSAQPSSNSSPEPTSTPYHDPQQIEPVILGVAITVAVLTIGLGLLVYLIKRK
jgi:outer membrane protein assembly factor BamB